MHLGFPYMWACEKYCTYITSFLKGKWYPQITLTYFPFLSSQVFLRIKVEKNGFYIYANGKPLGRYPFHHSVLTPQNARHVLWQFSGRVHVLL